MKDCLNKAQIDSGETRAQSGGIRSLPELRYQQTQLHNLVLLRFEQLPRVLCGNNPDDIEGINEGRVLEEPQQPGECAQCFVNLGCIEL